MVFDKEDVVQRIVRVNKDDIKVTLYHVPTKIKVEGETMLSRMQLIEDLMKKLEKEVNNKILYNIPTTAR
jgi:protein subunit release factor B